jgi:hypothetical protein
MVSQHAKRLGVRPIGPATDDRIREVIESSESLEEAAAALCLAPTTLAARTTRLGLNVGGERFDARLREAVEQAYSYREAAASLNLGVIKVAHHARRLGIRLRSPSDDRISEAIETSRTWIEAGARIGLPAQIMKQHALRLGYGTVRPGPRRRPHDNGEAEGQSEASPASHILARLRRGENVHPDAVLREAIRNAPNYMAAAKALGLSRMLTYLHAHRLRVVPKGDPA